MKQDLVVLVADGQMEKAIENLLPREESLGIRAITRRIYVHPSHDPGCLNKGHEFLRNFLSQFKFSIILFDREGCGQDAKTRDELEKQVEDKLSEVGWEHRSSAIVIDPELETWVWSRSPHVEEILGWKDHRPTLHEWLMQQGHMLDKDSVVINPKEAMENALRIVGKQRSSSYYAQLAKLVSLRNCTDPSFIKFKTVLQTWFPR